jgi:transcription elongation factor Elf1
MEREIWFKCNKCGTEAYCESNFARQQDAEVMCPICKQRMKLKEVRIGRGENEY